MGTMKEKVSEKKTGEERGKGDRGGGTNEDVLASGLHLVLQVESDEMLGETTISTLIDLVEDEVEEIESGDEGGREIWEGEREKS